MGISATSRFRILDQNELIAPGCCAVCGTARGQFIDFGLSLDFYGAVYFCFKSCFREAANAFEFYSPAQHRVLMEELEFLRMENSQQKIQIEEMGSAFKHITTNLVNRGIVSDSSNSDNITDEVSETELTDNESNETTESRHDEQTNEQGPPNVQRDDSLDEFIASVSDI